MLFSYQCRCFYAFRHPFFHLTGADTCIPRRRFIGDRRFIRDRIRILLNLRKSPFAPFSRVPLSMTNSCQPPCDSTACKDVTLGFRLPCLHHSNIYNLGHIVHHFYIRGWTVNLHVGVPSVGVLIHRLVTVRKGM